jgi:phage shock protein PspC (stress-responsive transcriptional regulator)
MELCFVVIFVVLLLSTSTQFVAYIIMAKTLCIRPTSLDGL